MIRRESQSPCYSSFHGLFSFLYIYIIDYILPIWLRVDEVLNDFLDVNSGVYYVLSSYQQDVKAVQILLILYKRYDNTITE